MPSLSWSGKIEKKERVQLFEVKTDASALFSITGDFGNLNASVIILDGAKRLYHGIVRKGVLKKFSSRKLVLDKDKVYTLRVRSTDFGKTTGEFTVTANLDYVFGPLDNSDDIWDADGLPEFNMATGWTDWIGHGDDTDFRVLNLDTAAKLSFDVTATDATKFVIWGVNPKSGNVASIKTTTLKANKNKTNYTARIDKLLDAGQYYISVQSTNAKTGGHADYTVTLNENSVFFTKGNNSDDAWNADGVTEFDATTEWTDWAGYSDAVDFRALNLDTAARLSFDVKSTDEGKITLWKLNAKTGQLKSIQTESLSANNAKTEYATTTKALLVEAGSYFISFKATSAKKGGNADYTITAGDAWRILPKGDNTNDTWKVAAQLDAHTSGEKLSGWVGFGDKADFFKIEVAENGSLTLNLDETTAEAVAGKELTLSLCDEKGRSISFAPVDADTFVSGKTLAPGSLYYLGVSCTNPNKYDTSYSIAIA